MGHRYLGSKFHSATVIVDLAADIFRPFTAKNQSLISTRSYLWRNNRGAGCLQIIGVRICHAPRTLEIRRLWSSISPSKPVSEGSFAEIFDNACGLRVH